MRFHLSRIARDRLHVDPALIAESGNISFSDFHAARWLAERLNAARDPVRFPERAVRAGQLNAVGLLGAILDHVTRRYATAHGPDLMEQAARWVEERVGQPALERTLRRFHDLFPPAAALRPPEPQRAPAAPRPARAHLLHELLQLWLSNVNPAQASYIELFDDDELERDTAYLEVIEALRGFFDTRPAFGPEQDNLIDMLRRPARAEPHSLPGQLEYIRKRWGHLLGADYYRLLRGLDLIREEEQARAGGAGPARVHTFAGLELETERFSADRDWMPRVVLMAKNACIWLDQLSRRHGRAITRLDQVPDQELQRLARAGLNALWLIGIWERSPASQRIKRRSGNPHAVASAYAIRDYQIAAALGGDGAGAELRERAAGYGLRLACDMVPNHAGIDSPWVIEHPDWFLSVERSPFPAYTFDGPDLCDDPRVGIYLEDHYTTRQDAAVVFKRVDHQTGDVRYIYHGNDGTRMPWNDTAQLNYLNPTVRKAVTRTILEVARRFPIIRFDAAMTLTRRHYQRLWFPAPGTGGAIPSRAEHGLDAAAFNARMPAEFWRQVVERVAAETPDTLLLAEAFWLMEGYFVRSLGMHRVYNSAFMVMLRDEDNADYRSVMKNALEFEPRILERYVNFMSNPDERTAGDQFGKEDKYFAACTLLATLPGLPMFGHGQLEGWLEKYGMDYQQARWNEPLDQRVLARHEREIVPLLHRRALFAGVEGFLLYDFVTAGGQVDDNVFAYSNRTAEGKSLVIVHNRHAETRGWLRRSVTFTGRTLPGGGRRAEQCSLGEGLDLTRDRRIFTRFRDQLRGLEYLRSNAEIHQRGLYVELGAYDRQVFLDFRQVEDDAEQRHARLCAYLDGRGVPSIEEAMGELLLEPLHQAVGALLRAVAGGGAGAGEPAELVGRLVREAGTHAGSTPERQEIIADGILREVAIVRTLLAEPEIRRPTPGEPEAGGRSNPGAGTGRRRAARRDARTAAPPAALPPTAAAAATTPLPETLQPLRQQLAETAAPGAVLWGWLCVHALGGITGTSDSDAVSRARIDEWLLGRVLTGVWRERGLDGDPARRALLLVKLLTSHQSWCVAGRAGDAPPRAVAERLLRDVEIQQWLQVHRHRGILWFNKEAFEELLAWLHAVAAVRAAATMEGGAAQTAFASCGALVERLRGMGAAAGYRVEDLVG